MTELSTCTDARQNEPDRDQATRTSLTDAEGQERLHRFLLGDERALDEIIAAYSPMIYGVFLRWFRLEVEDAEDLFQEVLLQLVVKADRIRSLRPWLLGTAMNQARKRIRRLVRDRKLAERATTELDSVVRPDTGWERDLVNRALAMCCDSDRELLLLAFAGELSYREISDHLGRPIGSIGPMRGRALDRMRTILDELESSPSAAN